MLFEINRKVTNPFDEKEAMKAFEEGMSRADGLNYKPLREIVEEKERRDQNG